MFALRRTALRAVTSTLPRVAAMQSGAVSRAASLAPTAAFSFGRAPISQRFYSAGPEPLTVPVIQERVLNVLRDFDKVDASKLTLDSHFITDLGLDSLDQVEITIAIEEEFNIELSDKDADDILTPRAASEKVFANKAAM
ncbi:Acyl carrier protein 1, mitochondrial [Podochytrium sp. JEL0797]|nr:Acyl carrier protein 1, mitochondrial [Podochytrium sp. JEL0797]